jgi:hypothetical protein
MRLLLWLYPRGWRDRYRAEMEALLQLTRPTPRVAWDLLRGGLDARLHPRWPAVRRRVGLRALRAPTLVLMLGAAVFLVARAAGAGTWRPVAAAAVASAALGALLGLAGRRLRGRRHGSCPEDGDLEGGAGVPARPRPDAPPVLSAAAGGASPGSGRRSDPG